jgi:alanine racemase
MPRPTRLIIDSSALLHNVRFIKRRALGKQIYAMVKANAYGCGIKAVAPLLDGQVDALGVASLEEALTIRDLGVRTPCILVQGVFTPQEFITASLNQTMCVIHHDQHIQWLLNTPLPHPIKLWVKVNTGMNRLGFKIDEVEQVLTALIACSWVDKNIGLMTHMACADEPERSENTKQVQLFEGIIHPGIGLKSMANSAVIIAHPEWHADVVRPGIMLYGVSPIANQIGQALGLRPVARFMSAITAIHPIAADESVGYSGTWKSQKPSVIGVVAAGYGDGYPRHISPHTPVWVNGHKVPIVGRVSMDMLTIDITNHPDVALGDEVELWGAHVPIEAVAESAGTIGYELLCQMTERMR